MVWNNTVSSPASLRASKRFLKTATRPMYNYVFTASWITTSYGFNLNVSCWLYFLTWTIWYWYLYIKNSKVVNTYHQVFCCPENVNTKRENPIGLWCQLYAVRLYRVLWQSDTLSLLLLWTLDNTDSNNSLMWSRAWPACNHGCNTETCPNKENNSVQ